MDILNDLYLSNILHSISGGLMVPDAVGLILALLYTLYSLGTLAIEAFTERKRYRAVVPQLVAEIEKSSPEGIPGVVERSGLLRSQKDDLLELNAYLSLPEDGRIEVAKRLIGNEKLHWDKSTGRTDMCAKVGPMLGLMGTLIPLGPGLVALSSGDTATLSTSLQVAFDSTTAGLAAAIVCFLISRVRKRWYRDYLVSMEAAMNALLERGRLLHDAGFEFPELVCEYDKHGRTAHIVDMSKKPVVVDKVQEDTTREHPVENEEVGFRDDKFDVFRSHSA